MRQAHFILMNYKILDDAHMELYRSSLECEEQRLETFENKECPAVCKTLAKLLRRGCGLMHMDMRDMFGFYAEEDVTWKSWILSDKYFEAMTVRCVER